MITAVDTNVLLDLLIPHSEGAESASQELEKASAQGRIVLNEIVYAELGAHFPSIDELETFISDTGLEVCPSDQETWRRAGQAWSTYSKRRKPHIMCVQCGQAHPLSCTRCGAPLRARQHLITDFLIGAYAEIHADQLLTRDRGYYRTYFPNLVVCS